MSDAIKAVWYCEKCEKDTLHNIEQGECLNNGGGYPHNDDHVYHYECLECGHTFDQI